MTKVFNISELFTRSDIKCEHSNMDFINEYYNLYYCSKCDTYWIPIKKFKNNSVKFARAYVLLNDDDKIIYFYCEYMQNLKIPLTKEEKAFEKWKASMYPKNYKNYENDKKKKIRQKCSKKSKR